MSIYLEYDPSDPRKEFYDSSAEVDLMEAAAQVDDIDEALELLYPTDLMREMTADILKDASFTEKCGDRQWAVAILADDDPRADIAKRVETERFSKFFDHHPLEHYVDYGIYDKASIFVTVIDAAAEEGPKAASVLRIVRNSELGLKTINTLSTPNQEENPWYKELTDVLGDFSYEDRRNVQEAITQMFGVNPDTTWAIETMAVLDEYAGKKGEFGEASFPLYAACLQLSDRAGIESWISIQDLKPLLQMQELFSNPWSFTSLSVQSYEGDFPTIPAVIQSMPEAQQNLRNTNPAIAELLIDGVGLSDAYVMPEELQGNDYLDYIANT